MSRPKHKPMTVHQAANDRCHSDGHQLGEGVYQFDSDGFTFGTVCLCAPSRQVCETCAQTWPCDEHVIAGGVS